MACTFKMHIFNPGLELRFKAKVSFTDVLGSVKELSIR